jgi:hypothetical protein
MHGDRHATATEKRPEAWLAQVEARGHGLTTDDLLTRQEITDEFLRPGRGQGRAGKGREGQGRAGKGREGQGRAGKGRDASRPLPEPILGKQVVVKRPVTVG